MNRTKHTRPSLDTTIAYTAPQFKEIFPEAQQQVAFDYAWLVPRIRVEIRPSAYGQPIAWLSLWPAE